MSFQWLGLRIQEERDRREREKLTLERLPLALEELHGILKQGVTSYTDEFGNGTVEIVLLPSRIKITARDPGDSRSAAIAKSELILAPDVPGFRLEVGEQAVNIEVGILGNSSLYYRDLERDAYLNMEDLTRRVLDRVLFPKLRD